jgi:hypothetical protein
MRDCAAGNLETGTFWRHGAPHLARDERGNLKLDASTSEQSEGTIRISEFLNLARYTEFVSVIVYKFGWPRGRGIKLPN